MFDYIMFSWWSGFLFLYFFGVVAQSFDGSFVMVSVGLGPMV